MTARRSTPPGPNPLPDPPPNESLTGAALAEAMFSRFETQQPNPEGELNWTNSYTLLVAVTLSAQATDRKVNEVTATLFSSLTHPDDMLALGPERLTDSIKSIGLYASKARNLIRQAEQLISRHNGRVPEDAESLEALAGVGRKTANVVRNIAFGHPTLAVDTHVFRVANRTGLAPGRTPLAVEKGLVARIPDPYRLHAHHWLILHGRYVCKARTPLCTGCVIRDLCAWPEKTA